MALKIFTHTSQAAQETGEKKSTKSFINLCSLPNIISTIKSNIRREGHQACMQKMNRNVLSATKSE
jgi:hypothetical protein